MKQYSKVAYFLRHLMEENSDRGSDTDRDTHEITCSDDETIDEIVDYISDEIHDSKRMDMILGNRHMTVISMDDLLGKEPKKDSSQDKDTSPKVPQSLLYHFWKEMNEDVAKQCSSGKADKQEQDFFEICYLDAKGNDSYQGNETDSKDADEGIESDLLHDTNSK